MGVGARVGTPVATPRPGRISHSRVSQRQTSTYRMDNEDDAVERAQPARPSSLTRGYQTLGAEMFNLDSDVESKQRRPKLHKFSKLESVPFSATLSCDSPRSPSFLASNGRAVLGSFRARVASPGGGDVQDVLGVRSELTAMEMDLGFTRGPHPRVGAVEKCFTHTMQQSGQETTWKIPTKSNLLPSLAGPGKVGETGAWSVKMAHTSVPRGGHRSVF